ncbi:hypothetical protein Hypma_000177 [Hypsizygus marmoreus]|uniref:Uncharacterized protein n=1 Tax=Hypsizygus marmoreus TaxID=39966 RepID=A0A369KBL1_HYPMA|nr:hypothetical protein Hypma_000177 [Hypsizygus marmoreus]
MLQSPDAQWQSRIQLTIVPAKTTLIATRHVEAKSIKDGITKMCVQCKKLPWFVLIFKTRFYEAPSYLNTQFKKNYAKCFLTELLHVFELLTDCYYYIEYASPCFIIPKTDLNILPS